MSTRELPGFERELGVGGRPYRYHSLAAAEAAGRGSFARLPYSLKVLAENVLRHEDRPGAPEGALEAVGAWCDRPRAGPDVGYHPSRVVIPEIGAVPLLVDLCAMRDAMAQAGGDPQAINPLTPVDVIVDHSVVVDVAGTPDAVARNTAMEFARNGERYRFLKWAQGSFANLRLVPPGNGILHQINLERLATVVTDRADAAGTSYLFPDCLIGMDSHTPMINALGVMGWGVGGVEAAAAMLGQPISLRLPEVVGCRLTGRLRPGVTSTDLVLTVVERLREHGVVQKFVEFCGAGLDALEAPDRATLANMAPEYGATMGFVPVDARTLSYLETTGRSAHRVALVEAYARAQGLWREPEAAEPVFTDVVEIDLAAVAPTMAGPFRPNQRVSLGGVPRRFAEAGAERGWSRRAPSGPDDALHDGTVAIAAITSCTNTSNPAVMIGAGLLARNARDRGLTARPWVKRSLAPGSRVVADYLARAGLQEPLDALGFNLVGFGCTTCMGNSGDIEPAIADAVDERDLVAVAVLSGNRNFEGRVHPQCKAAFLGSPPLVVAYALAGSITVDLEREPLGRDPHGDPVFLRDIWPSREEVESLVAAHVRPDLFASCYAPGGAFEEGTSEWQALEASGGTRFEWDPRSQYLVAPPYFEAFEREPAPLDDVRGARALLLLGDTVTTDHISPVSVIPPASPAGRYLREAGVGEADLSSYAARRANHEVMVRGTFGSPRLTNELCPDAPGGTTRLEPSGELLPVFEAAERYRAAGTPLVVIAGREYGTGSSRDWAAKGSRLLGVRAVVAESIERIHRSNLVGLGVLPLEFPSGVSRLTLGLDGTETFDLSGLAGGTTPGGKVTLTVHRAGGEEESVDLISRLDTQAEVDYFRHGGMLPYVLRRQLERAR